MIKKKWLKPDQPKLDRQVREFEAALYWLTGRWYSQTKRVVIARIRPLNGSRGVDQAISTESDIQIVFIHN